MDFQYPKLNDPREFRVLELEPSFSPHATLSCKLITTKLTDDDQSSGPPRYAYEALSYTWDGQIPDRRVNCQGNDLLITANCEAALLQLRQRWRRRILWIDSICINQTSDNEKGQQVQIMGEIYKQAKTVIVWLGEGSTEISQIFWHLSLLQRISKSTIAPYSIRRRTIRALALRISKMQELNSNQLEQVPRHGLFVVVPEDRILAEVFSRGWFTRMWTLQEAILARKCLVRCSPCSPHCHIAEHPV